MYKEVKGDLIKMALEGVFDVVAHGCNCFCTMGAGIAPQMAKAFGCDEFKLEGLEHRGNFNKLGVVEDVKVGTLTIINCYTQFGFGANHEGGTTSPLNYTALTMCLQKINWKYKGKKVGLPQIGCGLAGGDWDVVKLIIQQELKDCDVTVVIYKK
jgi:O-acetyl-ADP-ribose deacetylase (regulator of RNase III)